MRIYMSEHSEPDIQYSNPVKTKWDYPYSYDPILIYKSSNFKQDKSFYSDRLVLWDKKENLDILKKKYHLNDYCWSNQPVEVLNNFISDFFEQKIEINRIIEMCNVSNGYPYWLINYSVIKD